MVLRRRQTPQPPPPEPPELERIDAAKARLSRFAPASTEALIGDLRMAVADALADRERLRALIGELNPERIGAELKQALRERRDPSAEDDRRVASLRSRYESVSHLQNKLDEVEGNIATALVDLDTTVAEAAAAALASQESGNVDRHLQQLKADTAALAAAHRELEHL